ncbi:hypothetical protein EHQ46_05770 [Leptospira yanagawae]|uniref:DUF4352 domain-containing protein n=1 Tax=Leptospira yanagawae TaxID=293069 RepID=A0ABY2M3K2_9LEPT|nr:hypothetical protein [Leptospira yanagawae]TGL23144.1 hypothetical protein EHQ46_05770 [Leptospira yanagawae]
MKVKIILIMCVLSYNCQSLKNREVSKVSNNEIGLKITGFERNINSVSDGRQILTVKDSSKNEFVKILINFQNKTKNNIVLDISNAYVVQIKLNNPNEKQLMVPSSLILSEGGVFADFRTAYYSLGNNDFLSKFELNEKDEETRALFFLVERGASFDSLVFPKLGNLETAIKQ